MLAVLNENLALVRLLIPHSNLELIDSTGKTALHLAAERGSVKLSKISMIW